MGKRGFRECGGGQITPKESTTGSEGFAAAVECVQRAFVKSYLKVKGYGVREGLLSVAYTMSEGGITGRRGGGTPSRWRCCVVRNARGGG